MTFYYVKIQHNSLWQFLRFPGLFLRGIKCPYFIAKTIDRIPQLIFQSFHNFRNTELEKLRHGIIEMLFKQLTSTEKDIVKLAQEGLELYMVEHKIPKPLLQVSLRPILMNLAHYNKLKLPLLQGLARLLQLLTAWFNISLGEDVFLIVIFSISLEYALFRLVYFEKIVYCSWVKISEQLLKVGATFLIDCLFDNHMRFLAWFRNISSQYGFDLKVWTCSKLGSMDFSTCHEYWAPLCLPTKYYQKRKVSPILQGNKETLAFELLVCS